MTNPFSPPRIDAPEPRAATVVVLQDAPLGARFANVALDTGFRMAFSIGTGRLGVKGWIAIVVALGMGFAYNLFFEWTLGRTPAKFITRTRVVSDDGHRATFLQCFARSVFRYVPFEAFSFFGDTPTGWHDRWSQTRVIKG
jgi:uncharacterized RDD family membrane protein YckC